MHAWRGSLLFSGSELPGGRHTEDAAPAAIGVDAEPALVEVADEDTVAARAERGGSDVHGTEQEDVPDRLVRRHAPDCLGSVRDELETGQQGLLLAPVLAEGAGNRFLAEGDPPSFRLVVPRERLLVLGVPATRLRVEVGGVEVADVEERQRTVRTRHQDEVVVPEPLEVFARRKRLLERVELVFRVHDARILRDDLLGADEVPSEDHGCEVIRRSRLRDTFLVRERDLRATGREKCGEVATSRTVVDGQVELLHRDAFLGDHTHELGDGVDVAADFGEGCDVGHRMPPCFVLSALGEQQLSQNETSVLGT